MYWLNCLSYKRESIAVHYMTFFVYIAVNNMIFLSSQISSFSTTLVRLVCGHIVLWNILATSSHCYLIQYYPNSCVMSKKNDCIILHISYFCLPLFVRKCLCRSRFCIFSKVLKTLDVSQLRICRTPHPPSEVAIFSWKMRNELKRLKN